VIKIPHVFFKYVVREKATGAFLKLSSSSAVRWDDPNLASQYADRRRAEYRLEPINYSFGYFLAKGERIDLKDLEVVKVRFSAEVMEEGEEEA